MASNKAIPNLAIVCSVPLHMLPSLRFRFAQYFTDAPQQPDAYPFLSEQTQTILHQPGKTARKVLGVLGGVLRRCVHFFQLIKYEYIFISKGAASIGPPIFEWLIIKVLRKKVIYDFDDAIWLAEVSEENRLAAGLKWRSKVKSISTWAYKVSAGNAYLADYARQFNDQVILIPTVVDTDHYHNQVKDQLEANPIVVGWTGSRSTLVYLDELVPILAELEAQYEFEFQVIADRDPKLPLKSFRFIEWKASSEIEDLLRFNIGLMPLTDDKWAKGKCGFKAIQYMALGIPAIVAPVGVNTEIVDHRENGFYADSTEEWRSYIEQLLTDQDLRIQMGAKARRKIVDHYSVQATRHRFFELFQ